MNKLDGLVTKSTGSWYDVRTATGEVVACRLRGQFRISGNKNTNPVVVGDHVQFAMEKDGTGCITNIAPRTNYINRKSTKLSKLNHLIAANIDIAFLVVTLKQPRTSLGFIDRFLVAAESFRIPVCLIFNKMDLYDAAEMEKVHDIQALYRNIGYDVLPLSTRTGLNLPELNNKMAGKVSLFSGHSGVGKSAILNCIDPALNLKVGDISNYHEKGQHTTTFAQMFPLRNGGFFIDTPGIKEFGLIQYSQQEIRDYFPEIRKYNNQCKYDNCLHLNEPHCKVTEAVQNGDISLSRFANYLEIINDEDMLIKDWKLR